MRVFAHRNFVKEEFYIRRVHQILTDFVVSMPLKVKELRNRSDDAARNHLAHEQEGVHYAVPLAGQHFEHLLRSLAALHRRDELNLGLVTDFWCPTPEANAPAASMTERIPQRQVSLYKFVRLAGDLLMPSLYAPYLELLASLSQHPQAALHCFNLLKLNGIAGNAGQPGAISWDHFFGSLHQYFANLRSVEQLPAQHAASAGDPVYHLGRPMTRGISPAEIEGLTSVLRLVQAVADHCKAARMAMAENSVWQPVLVAVGLLGCAVPVVLKAELLKTLAALARDADVAQAVWQSLESARLVDVTRQSGLAAELENVEARNEEYPLTRAFLSLLDSLTDADALPVNLGAGFRKPGFEPYLHLACDLVFLRFNARSYRRPSERWQVAAACLKLFSKLLGNYAPVAGDFTEDIPVGQHPGFLVARDLFRSSEMLRVLLFILDEGRALLDVYQPFVGKEHLET